MKLCERVTQPFLMTILMLLILEPTCGRLNPLTKITYLNSLWYGESMLDINHQAVTAMHLFHALTMRGFVGAHVHVLRVWLTVHQELLGDSKAIWGDGKATYGDFVACGWSIIVHLNEDGRHG